MSLEAVPAGLLRRAGRIRFLRRVRPTILASPLLHLLSRRYLVSWEGLRLFVDPITHFGQTLIEEGAYEPETTAIFRRLIKPGFTVLDIGANEGFFACLASQLAGPGGLVVAVEPQQRIADVLEINLALNRFAHSHIVHAVVAEADYATAEINLFPLTNSGASSLVRRYRFGSTRQKTLTRTPTSIAHEFGIETLDFVKVDVEGYEAEVARSLAPLLKEGRVRHLLLDYHQPILDQRGIDPAQTNALILDQGMKAIEGDYKGGYVLYSRSDAGGS